MRAFKTGLDYFSFDVDFFDDEKIEFVSAKFGELGELILIKLLCRIYRNGYYMEFGEDEQILFAKRSGENITIELVNQVVDEAIKRNFFSKEHFEKYQILTSNGIQKRYLEATQRRKEIPIFSEYLINDNINLINVNIINLNDDKKKQSKVKESKVKESKGNDSVPVRISVAETNPETQADFLPDSEKTNPATPAEIARLFFYSWKKNPEYRGEQFNKFANILGDELERFCLYWTEPSKNGKKVRWEMEKTWELGRRISNWMSRKKIEPGTNGKYLETFQERKEREAEERRKRLVERLEKEEAKKLNEVENDPF